MVKMLPLDKLVNALKDNIILVVGKGGVGKTTVSILLSYIFAREKGYRTLLASLDPAKHLLEYLKIPKPQKKYEIIDRLEAIQYDVDAFAKQVADEIIVMLKKLMPGLTALNLDYVLKSLRDAPGFEEEVMLRIIESLVSEESYDKIVIDTPPTGITLRVLAMPRIYLAWVRSLKDLREQIVSIKYAIARALGRREEVHDPVLEKLAELENTFSRLADLFRKAMSYVVVATPEPLPIYEATIITRKLQDSGARPHLFVLNRVLGEKAKELGLAETELESIRELEKLRCSISPPPPLMLIRQLDKPTRSLEDVARLYQGDFTDLKDRCD